MPIWEDDGDRLRRQAHLYERAQEATYADLRRRHAIEIARRTVAVFAVILVVWGLVALLSWMFGVGDVAG